MAGLTLSPSLYRRSEITKTQCTAEIMKWLINDLLCCLTIFVQINDKVIWLDVVSTDLDVVARTDLLDFIEKM